MKKIFTILLFPVFLSVHIFPQDYLHQVEFISEVSRDDLEQQLGVELLTGVAFYKMTYHTTGSDGDPDIASGLIVLPLYEEDDPPLLIYHHGTSNTRDMVPSLLHGDYEAYSFFGGSGYVVIAPDYLGMGESRGFHPYVHRQTQASASVDMLKAFAEWSDAGHIQTDGHLFITGYSQGGHAGMSAHQLLESSYNEQFPVTAAAHLSGPYSLSLVMRDLMFSEENYDFPGFIPYVMLGFQQVYGDVYQELNEIFFEPFIPAIEQFYAGEISLTGLSLSMITLSTQIFGNRHPVNYFNPALVEAMLGDDNHPINLLLRENDSYRWAPQAPTRLYYCQADNLVPYQNSLVAEAGMYNSGAVDVLSMDVNSGFNHQQCFEPAILATLDFFNGFFATSVDLDHVADAENWAISLYPIPTRGKINIDGHSMQDLRVRLYDTRGVLLMDVQNKRQIDLSHLPEGMYFVLLSDNYFAETVKIIKE